MTETAAWLQRMPSPLAAGRVFCVPHAGHGTGVFEKWPLAQDSIEFLPVELPGRLPRFEERIPDTFQDLAKAMIAGLKPYFDVPFAFFGHCWSALAAYEATAQLYRADSPRPVRLFVSSQVAPQDEPVGRMLNMGEKELSKELETTIRALGREPHPDLISIYVDVLRADIEVRRRYIVPDPPWLACPITAIGWTDDAEIGPRRLGGWAQCGDTTFTVFSGGELRFMDAPPELVDLLCAGMMAT